ncbi:unnamed protein product [Orchesella dallaii]|uniref:Uncharacterized protein n=1 Tax=Orchesella dallaii TaxID=48710 RepID=A0ABP1RS70_9HEXA
MSLRYYYNRCIIIALIFTQPNGALTQFTNQQNSSEENNTGIKLFGNANHFLTGLDTLISPIPEHCHVHIITQSVHFHLDPKKIHTTLTLRELRPTESIIEHLNVSVYDVNWKWNYKHVDDDIIVLDDRFNPRIQFDVARFKQAFTMKCIYTIILSSFQEIQCIFCSEENRIKRYIPFWIGLWEMQLFYRIRNQNDVLNRFPREPRANYVIHISTTSEAKWENEDRSILQDNFRYINIYTATIECDSNGNSSVGIENEVDLGSYPKSIPVHISILTNDTAFQEYSHKFGVTSRWSVLRSSNTSNLDNHDNYKLKNSFRLPRNNSLVFQLAVLNLLASETNSSIFYYQFFDTFRYTFDPWPRIFPEKRLKSDYSNTFYDIFKTGFVQLQFWETVIISRDSYNFLTCYNEDSITFAFYFQPFQLSLWITLVNYLPLLALLTHIILILKKVNKSDFNTYFFAYSSILEHSFHMPNYLYKIESIRIVFGLWLLVSVIFTNAYKGIAITGVTAPPSKSSIQTFSEVVDDSDKLTYSGSINSSSKVNFHIITPLKVDYFHEWEFDGCFSAMDANYSDESSGTIPVKWAFRFRFNSDLEAEQENLFFIINSEYGNTSVSLNSLDTLGRLRMLSYRLYNKLFSGMCDKFCRYIIPKKDEEDKFSLSYDIAMEREIVKCENKVVYVDTQSKIDKEYGYLSGHYHHKSFFKGNESLLPDYIVWQFDNGIGSRLPTVFKQLIENGIYRQLEWFYRNQEQLGIRLEYTRNHANEKYEPVKKLDLKSNIQTIFYVYLFGHLVSILFVGLEGFWNFRGDIKNYVKIAWRNFLQLNWIRKFSNY